MMTIGRKVNLLLQYVSCHSKSCPWNCIIFYEIRDCSSLHVTVNIDLGSQMSCSSSHLPRNKSPWMSACRNLYRGTASNNPEVLSLDFMKLMGIKFLHWIWFARAFFVLWSSQKPQLSSVTQKSQSLNTNIEEIVQCTKGGGFLDI